MQKQKKGDVLTKSGSGTPNDQHRQVRVTAFGQDAYIDEEIVPLIKEMWQAGITTSMSCQNLKRGFVWLYFSCPLEARNFINIVAEYEDDLDSIYQRVLARDNENLDNWIYKVIPDDTNLIEEYEDATDSVDEWHCGEVAIEFCISVLFPRRDLPLVVDRIRSWRQSKTF